MTADKVVIDATGEVVEIKGVHPVAALFPMLDSESLTDLADSIRERGQAHPVVIDDEDQILDGRNRHAACQMNGTVAAAVRYEGDDPAGYALAVNLNRRNLNKGQQAVLYAQGAGFLKTTQRDLEKLAGISHARLAYARTVLTFAGDLAAAIVSGALPLNDAYAEARERKTASESEEARMSRLADAAPDLAELVTAEKQALTLAEAEARLKAREAHAREVEQARAEALSQRVDALDRAVDFLTEFAQWPERIGALRDAYVPLYPTNGITADKLRLAVNGLNAIRKAWK